MSLDPKIIEAIESATENAGQPKALAKRLIAWFKAVADESEDINSIAAADRRLDLIYDAVILGPVNEGELDEGMPGDEVESDDEEIG